MKAMENVRAYMRQRPFELKKLKEGGRKIVGYVPDGYFPEDLAWASGAIPVGLIRGGDHEAVERSAETGVLRFLDSFCRAQIGYWKIEEPLYRLPDLMVVPILENNIKIISDCWEHAGPGRVFKFGIPHKQTENGLKYYLYWIGELIQKLQELTGQEINEAALKEEIDLSNQIRDLFNKISETRKSDPPAISGTDFITLNHASYLYDKRDFLKILKAVSEEVKEQTTVLPQGPRIMLTGSTIALGDSKVIDMLETAGANIVIEEFCEGIRHYRAKVEPNGDLVEALAERYFLKKMPCADCRGASRKRFDYLISLVKEYKVDGILWYSMMYRDSYDIEGFYFAEQLEKGEKIPFLKLFSDYDAHAELGPFRTRIETFVEMIKENK